ncbi:MAG: 5-(carboxyamino)imidazole ribonucleotide mutase [Archaeoglobus sp.]|nr:5-(carboxyamino)imidazole ribonucleotide mutase [Archaeoglobus sp.]
MKAVIIMGSKKDMEFSRKISGYLDRFGINSELQVASAHKTPLRVLEIIKEFEGEDVVYVTVAGRSNALSGMVDANTTKPVIACPPYSEKFAGMDVLSSLRMPSGVAPMVVLEAENAALAVAKIFALKDENLRKAIEEYQEEKRGEVLE